MNLHLVIPALCWPDTTQNQIYHELPLPYLEKLLAKSNRLSQSSEGLEAWLCQVFNIKKQQNWPIAPISLHEECASVIEGGKDYWIRADPVHLRIEQNHIMLADSHAFKMTSEEAEGFTSEINRNFMNEEWKILPLHPKRWYIHLKKTPEIKTYTLAQVTCKNINNYLSSGKDGVFWNNKFNEIQMILHEHPLNKAREIRGELAINSVWFWGGGVIPPSIQTSYTKIWSDSNFVSSLSRLSNIKHDKLPLNASAWLSSKTSEDDLIIMDELFVSAQYREAYEWRENLKKIDLEWFAPLYTALKRGEIETLTIITFNGIKKQEFVINRRDLWKFWLATKPLSFYKDS